MWKSLATGCDPEIMMDCRRDSAWAKYQWCSPQRLHCLNTESERVSRVQHRTPNAESNANPNSNSLFLDRISLLHISSSNCFLPQLHINQWFPIRDMRNPSATKLQSQKYSKDTGYNFHYRRWTRSVWGAHQNDEFQRHTWPLKGCKPQTLCMCRRYTLFCAQ